jgi:uncharacterized protein DUF3710
LFRRRRDAGTGSSTPASGPAPEFDDGSEFDYESGDLSWATGDGSDDDSDDDYRGRHAVGGYIDQQAGSGPWDSGEAYPERDRVDVGSLLIPLSPDWQVHLEPNEEQTQLVLASVTVDGGKLQMRALAAPKTAGLWDDERAEVATAISKLGGQTWEAEGPFGTELRAHEPAQPGSGDTGLQSARYLGVDGPRWLLCARITGPAADDPKLAAPLEEIFGGIVVVRGDHPAPPRDQLEIQLPPEMRAALAEQVAQAEAQAEAEQRRQYPNPFERGPEITETR